MISLLSVMAGCRPNSAAVPPPGVPPYSMMPGRTQSFAGGVVQQHGGRIRQAARPAAGRARFEAADLLGDRQQRWSTSSALAKWVISVMLRRRKSRSGAHGRPQGSA
jgi:hypothetical protein